MIVAIGVLCASVGSAQTPSPAAPSVPSVSPPVVPPAAPPPPAPPATAPLPQASRPSETADAVLHADNMIWGRQLHDALRLPAWIDFAVDHRTRFEFLDDAWRRGESSRETQVPMRNRFRIGVDAPGGVRFLGEFQDARIFNARPADFTATEVDHLDVLQLFTSYTRKNVRGSGLRFDAHVGRMTIDVGSRRLVSRNDFRNTVNAFDGIHLQIGGDDRKWRARFFYTLPVRIRESDLMNNRFSARRRFWGLVFEDLRNPWLALDAYFFDLQDQVGGRNLRTYGVRGYRKPAPGQIDYEAEVAGQFGSLLTAALVVGGQTLDHSIRDQSAWMVHGEVGYTFAVPWSPRMAAQFDGASGNDDPSDDDSHAFDPLFGSRRFDLMPTGLFGAFRRTNLLSPGVRMGLQPTKTIRLDLKVRYWMLEDGRDALAGSAGPGGGALVDATGRAGRDLGTDIELRARWDARDWLAFDAGYDHWFKGEYMDEVANVRRSGDSDYFYLQSRVKF